MRVRFTRDFKFDPPERRGRVTIAYKAGMELTVRRCCGEKAVSEGKAEEIRDVRRSTS